MSVKQWLITLMLNLKKFISYEEDIRWKRVFEILYYCGLRKRELKGLT